MAAHELHDYTHANLATTLATAAAARSVFAGRMWTTYEEDGVEALTFGDSFVPELREILTSISTATSYGRNGNKIQTREQPFTYPWQLTSIGYDPDLGRSRVICKLAAEGKTVTAIIDADDFRKLRGNNSRSRAWNGSEHYHDMAVLASTLIEEQVVTRDPSELGSEIQIKLPKDRMV